MNHTTYRDYRLRHDHGLVAGIAIRYKRFKSMIHGHFACTLNASRSILVDALGTNDP